MIAAERQGGVFLCFASTIYSRKATRGICFGLVCCGSQLQISLLPGWREALLRSYAEAGRPDLCFQREGGDDPFFAAFPYNSGFFLMNGSARAASFWRHVAARTERERPFTGDQGVVNNLLVARQADGEPGCTASPLELRHAHFEPRLVHGGPSVPAAAVSIYM